MDLKKSRRENLKKLISERFDGNNAEFCRQVNKNPNGINLILTKNQMHQRSMGESLAREIETKLRLPHGYFDRVPDGSSLDGVELFIWGADVNTKIASGKIEMPDELFHSFGFPNPKDCFIQIKNECQGLVRDGINPSDLMIVDKSDTKIIPIRRIFVCVYDNFIVTIPLVKNKKTITISWNREKANTKEKENPLNRSYNEKEFYSNFSVHGRVIGKLPLVKL